METESVSEALLPTEDLIKTEVDEPISEADKAYVHFVQSLPRIRKLREKLSLRALSRVFDAVVSFPYDEQSIARVKKTECDENELFLITLSALGAKKIMDHAMEKFKAEDEAVSDLVNKVKEANKQPITKEL